jgi:hypothetical protein
MQSAIFGHGRRSHAAYWAHSIGEENAGDGGLHPPHVWREGFMTLIDRTFTETKTPQNP